MVQSSRDCGRIRAVEIADDRRQKRGQLGLLERELWYELEQEAPRAVAIPSGCRGVAILGGQSDVEDATELRCDVRHASWPDGCGWEACEQPQGNQIGVIGVVGRLSPGFESVLREEMDEQRHEGGRIAVATDDIAEALWREVRRVLDQLRRLCISRRRPAGEELDNQRRHAMQIKIDDVEQIIVPATQLRRESRRPDAHQMQALMEMRARTS